MKKVLRIVLLSFYVPFFLPAQTVFWTETFGIGCSSPGNLTTSNGTWTITNTGTNGANANTFIISAKENGHSAGQCGTSCTSNDMALHVYSPVTGDLGAQYLSGGGGIWFPQADQRCESPVINCTGRSNITLKFNYIEFGDGTNDDGDVWLFDGTTWSQLVNTAKTTCCGGICNDTNQGRWVSFSAALPASINNNPNVKIGFHWVNNDDGIGSDPSFCVDSVTFSVVSAAVPVVSITPSPNNTICQNATLTMNGSATNGPILSWFWSVTPSAGVVFNPNAMVQNPTVTFTTAGTYTFALQATNSGGSGSTTQVITVLPSVTPSVSITTNLPNPVCLGQQSTFTATPSNGGTTPAYQWQVNGVNAGSNSPNFGPVTLNNGDVVSVKLTSTATCAISPTATANYTMQVNSPTAPSVTVNPNPVSACAGSSVTFTASPTNGGTNPSYQWHLNGANAGTNSPTFTLTNVSAGEQVYVVLTSNATCITSPTVSSNTVAVTVIAPPVISITKGTATVCPTQKDTLIAAVTAGSAVIWSPAAGLNVTSKDTVVASNAATGIYTYYITATRNGCSTRDSVKVTVANSFTAVPGPPITICFGKPARLSVTGGTTWTWTPSGLSCNNCQNPIATPSVSTTYTVVAASGACTNTVTESVTVIPNASAAFNAVIANKGIPQTVNFNNASGNAGGYYWILGDNTTSVLQNPSHTYSAEGTYTIKLIAYGSNGCNDTISTILLISDTVGISVPNIFTPNGDEINDVWKPGVHGATSLECTIYNRWGLKVYEFAGPQDHWDGYTTGGLLCQDGTYYYILKATDRNNKNYDFKGYLQLIH